MQSERLSAAHVMRTVASYIFAANGKVQIGNDQEKALSERNSYSKNRGGKKKQIDN